MPISPSDIDNMVDDEIISNICDVIDELIPDVYYSGFAVISLDARLTFNYKKVIRNKYIAAGWESVKLYDFEVEPGIFETRIKLDSGEGL